MKKKFLLIFLILSILLAFGCNQKVISINNETFKKICNDNNMFTGEYMPNCQSCINISYETPHQYIITDYNKSDNSYKLIEGICILNNVRA